MRNVSNKYDKLSWQQVLHGYSIGIFPMGDDGDSIGWYETSPRAILPLELPNSQLNIPRSLKQVMRKNIFGIRYDTSFLKVMEMCSLRESTWINPLIKNAYHDLHKQGYAHSVEAWKDGELAGGLYGVALNGAFFGESMFYTQSNASKAAVVKLYEILKKNRFILLDIQMMTQHFKTFGAIEISKKGYQEILDRALKVKREFIFN